MKRAVLVTGHVYSSKRKAGFHFLADALRAAGWDVLFFTAALSRFSRWRGDPRINLLADHPPNRIESLGAGLSSFIWYTPWHPANTRSSLLNIFSKPLFRRYGDLALGPADGLIADADLFLFESNPGLLLFDRFKKMNARARFIYRVSDDLRFLRNHPVVIETEDRVAPMFDLISSPCAAIHRRFAHLPQARLQFHAINKNSFDACRENPYPPGTTNVIFVGTAWFDGDFLIRAARAQPNWRFHICGDVKDIPFAANVTPYGETPFEETIPYIKFANVGLQSLTYRPGAEAFTDSLKIIQYTYCRLPIVSPDFLRCERPNLFYYSPGDDHSILAALDSAARCDHASISPTGIQSWDELVADMLRP